MLHTEIKYSNNTNKFDINYFRNQKVVAVQNFLIKKQVDEGKHELESTVRKLDKDMDKILPTILPTLEDTLFEVSAEKGIGFLHLESVDINNERHDYIVEQLKKHDYQTKGKEDRFTLLEKEYSFFNQPLTLSRLRIFFSFG